MATTIILGSSRRNGNTNTIVQALVQKSGATRIDLLDYNIGRYDYTNQNKDDDFIPLIADIIDGSKTILFATPVYWYSMSGIMKDFVDRLTDCVTIRKDLGRRMQRMRMGLLSCGSEEALLPSFEDPFRETAGYLEMEWIGHVHTWLEEDKLPRSVDKQLTSLAITLNTITT